MKILVIDGTAGFTTTRLQEKPCGGIITSLTLIPRHLAANGHEVTVMSVYEHAEIREGVRYLPIKTDLNSLDRFDVVVFNRNAIDRPVATFFKNTGAKLVLWLHDIVDPRYFSDDGFTLVDHIVALSVYNQESYADFYGIDRDKFTIISNGVEPEVFYPDRSRDRRDNLFVTASAPIKGLSGLAFTWGNIKRLRPDAELRLYSSQKLHDLENSRAHDQQLSGLESLGAKIMDPVPQRELADVFRQTTALLMPNSYPEICSNVLLQARACGCPVVASNIGSAPEFIMHGKNGLLTHTQPSDLHWWIKDFAQLAAEIMTDKPLRDRISTHAPVGVPSWYEIGQEWNKMLSGVYSEAVPA